MMQQLCVERSILLVSGLRILFGLLRSLFETSGHAAWQPQATHVTVIETCSSYQENMAIVIMST